MKFLVLLSLAGCTSIYFLRGSLHFERGARPVRYEISNGARIHLGILLAIFLAIIAAGVYVLRAEGTSCVSF